MKVKLPLKIRLELVFKLVRLWEFKSHCEKMSAQKIKELQLNLKLLSFS
jgi:hypothetical protein